MTLPIRAHLENASFDPATIEILNAAYLAVCADLGLTDTTDPATQLVAKKVVEMANGARDPQQIRAAVLASFDGAR